MKNIFAVSKKKLVIGALSVGLISGGLAGASGFGFIQQLGNILGSTTDKAATYTAGQVTNKAEDKKTYEEKITTDVNVAANKVKTELVGHGVKEMNRGKGEVAKHYNDLKSDIDATADTAVSDGKTKITGAVNTKVTSIQSSVEDAAVAAINAQLNYDSQFTGTETVSK